MSIKRTYLIIAGTFTLLLMFHASGCKKEMNRKGSDKDMLTKKQIIEIANREATTRGIKVSILTKVLYDVNNKEWKQTYARIKKEDPNFAVTLRILEKTEYQAVCYYSRIPQPGGILWIFVNRSSGEIVATCGEM